MGDILTAALEKIRERADQRITVPFDSAEAIQLSGPARIGLGRSAAPTSVFP